MGPRTMYLQITAGNGIRSCAYGQPYTSIYNMNNRWQDGVKVISGTAEVDRAFRIAAGDWAGNIAPFAGGVEPVVRPCMLAGLDYDTPWTRDAALNSWYAGTWLAPGVARNTLEAVLVRDQHGLRIGGEYWDAISWATAAWAHVQWTGDREFLATALEAILHSLAYFERTERDAADGLFRGGACFQDGVSGYPDFFADGPTCGIADWVKAHPGERATTGHGLPMKALSTNALYYNAYRLLPSMARALGQPVDPVWAEKAEALRIAINGRFWNETSGTYRYLVDGHDTMDRQEGFGHAFALLFGVADAAKAAQVLEHQVVTAQGVPCVWPSYERYVNPEGTSCGRHSGTIWPQVNMAWAMAALQHGRPELAWRELKLLAEKAVRDNQFAELYHPVSGEIYGGMQEHYDGGPPRLWAACQRQTWCATGFMGLVLRLIFGLRVEDGRVSFAPWLPDGVNEARLEHLSYRGMCLNVGVRRTGRPGASINGRVSEAVVEAGGVAGATVQIEINL